MRNTFLVEEIQARGDLFHDLRSIVFRKADVFLNPRQERTTVDLLEHEEKLFLILEELDELQDVGMSLAMMEGLNFAEYTGSSMARNLINNLYGTLYVCVNIYTCLYWSISALPQNLARQLIQLCKRRKKILQISMKKKYMNNVLRM